MWPPNSPDVIVTDCCWLYSLYCISFVSVKICGLTILSVVFSLYSLRRCRSNINNALLSISTSLMWCWRQCSVQDLKRLSANINVLLILHFILTFVSYVLQQRELRVRIMFYHLQNSPSNNHTAQFLQRGDVIEVGGGNYLSKAINGWSGKMFYFPDRLGRLEYKLASISPSAESSTEPPTEVNHCCTFCLFW